MTSHMTSICGGCLEIQVRLSTAFTSAADELEKAMCIRDRLHGMEGSRTSERRQNANLRNSWYNFLCAVWSRNNQMEERKYIFLYETSRNQYYLSAIEKEPAKSAQISGSLMSEMHFMPFGSGLSYYRSKDKFLRVTRKENWCHYLWYSIPNLAFRVVVVFELHLLSNRVAAPSTSCVNLLRRAWAVLGWLRYIHHSIPTRVPEASV